MPALFFHLILLFIPPLIYPHYIYFNLLFEASVCRQAHLMGLPSIQGMGEGAGALWFLLAAHGGCSTESMAVLPGTPQLRPGKICPAPRMWTRAQAHMQGHQGTLGMPGGRKSMRNQRAKYGAPPLRCKHGC